MTVLKTMNIKPSLILSLAVLAFAPLASRADNPPPAYAAPQPQLVLNGDQWVIQVPPNTPVPRNIVLQLATPTNAMSPVVVLQQPAPQTAVVVGATVPSEVYVETAPPAIQEEVIPVSPGPRYIWIRGHYEWRDHRYVWFGGRWERPPHRDERWHDARWEVRGGRYFYVAGYWGR